MTPIIRSLYLLFIRIRNQLLIRLALIFLILISLGQAAIYFFEYNVNQSISSPFDVFYFVIVTISTLGYGDITPVTLGGKLTIICMVFSSIFFIALVSAITAATFVELKIKGEIGMKSYKFINHIVIVGWNYKGKKLVDTLVNEENELASKKIIIVADLEKRPVVHPLVYFVRSSNPAHSNELNRANIGHASSVIMLGDYSIKKGADTITAINCLLVRKLNPKVDITVEMLAPDGREYFEVAGATHIIGVSEIGGMLLARAGQNNQNVDEALKKIGVAC